MKSVALPSRRLRHCWRFLSVLVLPLLALFDPPQTLGFNQYVVECLLPRGGRIGTQVEATFIGNYLENPREVVSNRGGIRALSFQTPEPHSERFMVPGPRPEALRATLEIAPDCPPGAHLLFLRTECFLSDPVLFFVGDMPVVKETETRTGENDTPQKAQAIPLNSTVHGQILEGGREVDRDCFTVEVRKGDRLSVDLEAVRLGTLHYKGENDCQLRVFGPDGHLLASSDDTALYVQDPFLSLEAPKDGRYVIEVSQHRGALFTQLAHYLLHVGSFPRPKAVYPLGGRPGELLPVQLLEDGKGTLPLKLRLPAEATPPSPITVFEYFPEDTRGRCPSALPMRISAHPNQLENEPNDTWQTAQAFEFPAALNGVIGSEGDVDVWRFHATKGEAIDIRVFARTLGTPLDPKIWIRPARAEAEEEKPLAAADDALLPERGIFSHTIPPKGLLDPAMTFMPKETGEYVLGIEDTRGLSGATFVYRIEVQPHRESVCLYPSRNKRPATYDWTTREAVLQIPRGGRWTTNISLGEGLGTQFGAETFRIEAVGLPPGVTMEAPLLHPAQGAKEVPVQFVAAPGAQPGVSFIQLVAHPVQAQHPVDSSCQRGFVFSNRRGGLGWLPVWIEDFPLAVVEASPFVLDLEQPKIGLTRAGELDLHVRIQRQPGWNAPLELKLDYLPTGVEQGPPVEVPAGQTEATIALRAAADAPLHPWKVCVIGTTLDGHSLYGTGCRLVSSALVNLPVTEPFVTLDFQRSSVRRGDSGEITAHLKHLKPFSGKARASLIGLPAGVQLLEPFPEISQTDTSCTFRIQATPEALLGQYKQIQAEIAVHEGGQWIRQQTGSGILRVDPARASASPQ